MKINLRAHWAAALPGLALMLLPAQAHAAVQSNQFNNTVSDALACNGHPYIDVRCYGALGDGSHDDTSAINSAKSDAITNNVALHFSAGTYKVTSELTFDYAGIAGDGLRIISEGATIDGRTIASGPVLQVNCSGGTTGSPATCLYFNLRGRLTVLANTPSYAAVIGNPDLSDLHQGMKIEQLVAINSSTNAAAGGIQVNYVVGSDVWLDGSTSGGNASHSGVDLVQLQKSRLGGRGFAAGASAPSLLFENGIISGNVISGYSYAGSATCIRIDASATHKANFVIAPYYDCNLSLDASTGSGEALIQVAPTYAGNTRGPNSGGMATLGRGAIGRYSAPNVSSYLAAGVDDGLLLSSANATGAGAGWAASSLSVTLPSPAVVGAGWTMGFVTDAGKAVVLTPASGSILTGGASLSTMTLGPGNYQTAIVQSDGTNYRVLWASQETLATNGAANRFPSRWVYPGGPGYSATQGDNGNVLSSALTSGLTVTLPGTSTIAAGWMVGVIADGQALTLTGGNIVLLNGSVVTSYALPSTTGMLIYLQFDGASYRIVGGTGAVATAGTIRKVTGTTDTLLVTDAAVGWSGRVTAARLQTLPACPSGIDGNPRTISDDAGLAAYYPIQLTPSGGTINFQSSFVINWPYGAAEIRCDGVGNYRVTGTTLATPLATSSPSVSAVDTNSSIPIVNGGLGNAPQQISQLSLLGHGSNEHALFANGGVPQVIDADWWDDLIVGFAGTGNLILDVSAINFFRPYHFATDTTTAVYLDPGRIGFFQNHTQVGITGQLLRVSPGQVVTIRRGGRSIYTVEATNGIPSVMPFAQLPTPAGGSPIEIWCTDCRKEGEGGGSGTGAFVYFNTSTQTWFRKSGNVLAAI